jgi:cellulose-binding protein
MPFVRHQFGRLQLLVILLVAGMTPLGAAERLRLIIETDAGGDPDDEQSLVRFLLYANEWDIEGIIANRPHARDGENRNSERTGLGIVRRLLKAYGECLPKLVQHDPRYPTLDYLWQRTVAGHDNTDDAVNLIIATVDKEDSRPVWYSDWGTDHGAATNNLKRALDRTLRERGREGYTQFKSRFRLSSADAFGEHTSGVEPPFPLWVDTWRPEMNGKRWYHRFSAITARAGGFDLVRDGLTGHGPLGALYPTNTTHWQKEGDSLSFIYLIPTGLSAPNDPTLGGWGGRLDRNEQFSGKPYYWANQLDAWKGTTNRDNTLARWADAIQNDFKARLDWCVKPRAEANHPPLAKVKGELARSVRSGDTVHLDAGESTDPDDDPLRFEWLHYAEPGSYRGGRIEIQDAASAKASFVAPRVSSAQTAHLILAVTDDGSPPLTRYQRVVVTLVAGVDHSN